MLAAIRDAMPTGDTEMMADTCTCDEELSGGSRGDRWDHFHSILLCTPREAFLRSSLSHCRLWSGRQGLELCCNSTCAAAAWTDSGRCAWVYITLTPATLTAVADCFAGRQGLLLHQMPACAALRSAACMPLGWLGWNMLQADEQSLLNKAAC